MKKLLFLIAISSFTACGVKETKTAESSVFIEKKLNEFIAQHPDWTKDEALKKKTTENFQHKVINWSNETDFLKDMPLELKEVKDTLLSDQPFKIAVFKAYNDTSRNENSILNYTQLEINGLVSESQLKELSVGKKYTLGGSLYKQGKRADVKFVHVADFKGYDLGKYLFQITMYKTF
ncbi:hypothetical protein D9M68_420280 [compost metagenome]